MHPSCSSLWSSVQLQVRWIELRAPRANSTHSWWVALIDDDKLYSLLTTSRLPLLVHLEDGWNATAEPICQVLANAGLASSSAAEVPRVELRKPDGSPARPQRGHALLECLLHESVRDLLKPDFTLRDMPRLVLLPDCGLIYPTSLEPVLRDHAAALRERADEGDRRARALLCEALIDTVVENEAAAIAAKVAAAERKQDKAIGKASREFVQRAVANTLAPLETAAAD